MDKKEYIERQEVYSEINELPLTEDAAMEILWAIDHIPTADVAPVVHSSWEEIKEVAGGLFDYHFMCQNCHSETPKRSYVIAPDFCPNCGAKMDMDGEPHDP